jgi:hypothetical protein
MKQRLAVYIAPFHSRRAPQDTANAEEAVLTIRHSTQHGLKKGRLRGVSVAGTFVGWLRSVML